MTLDLGIVMSCIALVIGVMVIILRLERRLTSLEVDQKQILKHAEGINELSHKIKDMSLEIVASRTKTDILSEKLSAFHANTETEMSILKNKVERMLECWDEVNSRHGSKE